MKRLAPLLVAGLWLSLAGCQDNPYKATTWTKKLDDPRESERAVTQLEQLGDPSAIPALGQAWAAQGKPLRLLQVIIALARPLTSEEAKKAYLTDYEKEGRQASWKAALPFLQQALSDVDEANPRSVDGAKKAAEALGEAQVEGGIEALVEVATKPITKKLITAQVAATRALGEYESEKQKAATALVQMIGSAPPEHPRTAKDKEQARALEEKYGLFLAVRGAAINALSELRVPAAVPALILSMYRTPELFSQIRRALVASGPTAAVELRKILRGEHAEVNQLFKDNRLDTYCGDRGDGKDCLPVSAKDFYAAVVLGDFYDPASVPDLLVALDRPAYPQYYVDDQPSAATQYNAIFDALRKIGAPAGADRVRAMWNGKGAELPVRLLAIGAYPFLVRDDAGTEDLGKIAADNGADANLRTEAATAFARLAHSAGDIKVLTNLAQKYFDASDKKRKEADGKPKADADAADKELEEARKKVEAAKSAALKATQDTSQGADAIRAATEAAKKADEDLKAAKKKHRAATNPFRQADATAKAYKGYARMFQTHIARIAVAIRCKGDQKCFVSTLKDTPEQAATHCGAYIKDLAQWTKDEKLGLLEGQVERAMLELGKQGQAASAHTDALLDAAKSDDRIVRQSILLALPKIAKVPCANCEKKLDDAIKAGEGKSTLGDLNLETTMLRNYFAWAGGKTPAASAPAEPAGPAKPASE